MREEGRFSEIRGPTSIFSRTHFRYSSAQGAPRAAFVSEILLSAALSKF